MPNDWLEALILLVCGVGVLGSVIALWHLASQLP